MKVSRVTGRVLSGPVEPVYVYEAPIRVWHWLMMVAFFVLAGTGYLIGSPPPAIGGEATFSYFFATIRMVHFIAAMIFAVSFLVRIYWAFVGNRYAHSIFLPSFFSGEWWGSFFGEVKGYLFLNQEDERWIGHNPLAQFAMFAMYTLGTIVIILTGLALYAEQWGWGLSWMNWFGWVITLLGTPQAVRTVHHMTMWYLLLFAVVHMYMVFREDIMTGTTVISTMVNGIRLFKREPRH